MFNFNNSFAWKLYSVLSIPVLQGSASTVPCCACCSALVDVSTWLAYSKARLSDLRIASNSCMLCKFLLQAAERSLHGIGAESELVRTGAALRIGYEGPRILRLCIVPGQYPQTVLSDGQSRYLPSDSATDYLSACNVGLPIGFPVLPKAGSPAHFTLLREWLEWCDTNHNCSRRDTRSQAVLPTRLIYVGHSDPDVLRLCLPKECETMRYTALSHCWGRNPPTQTNPQFCTTDSNINARLKGFSFSELPKTFQDAVRVTQELGIEYLWIDSICIIQWNSEDWSSEANLMQGVFASAYCTIAATSAIDSNAGFLARNGNTEYMRVQVAPGNQLHVCTDMDNFDKDVEEAQLNMRAWVMQERILARRTIHFSNTQTYWECGDGVYCENLTMMTRYGFHNA